MTPRELTALYEAALARPTPGGLSWPMSLTFTDGTYLPAVRCIDLRGSGGVDRPTARRLIGHDLGRNEVIDVSMDDLAEAHLTEEAWEEAILPPEPPREVSFEALLKVSPERKRHLARFLSKEGPISPLDDEVPFYLVTFDRGDAPAAGGPSMSQEETRVAVSLLDPSLVFGDRIWVEREGDVALGRVVRIVRAQISGDEPDQGRSPA